MWPFTRRKATVSQYMQNTQLVHAHEYMRLIRLQNPPRDVWECNCGARIVDYLDKNGIGTAAVQLVAGPTSLDNVLLHKGNCTLQGCRLI